MEHVQVNVEECIKNKLMSQVVMIKYDCHKQVHAIPMDKGLYNKVRGWDIPDNEDPKDKGYLIVYNRGTLDEYVSWSPFHVFDNGYSETIMFDSNEINNFEIKLTRLINQESTIPIVTIYGVLKLIASDMLNKASMARVMLSKGDDHG